MPNVRIRSSRIGPVKPETFGEWFVEAKDTKRFNYILDQLNIASLEEPHKQWRIETCGTDGVWRNNR